MTAFFRQLFSTFRNRLLLAGILIAIVIGWFWWTCSQNDEIDFLPSHRGAEWIIYPAPPDPGGHWTASLSTEFRRTFLLDTVPRAANATFSAFKGCRIVVNGQEVATHSEAGWKQRRTIDVAKYLRTGTNEMSVTVLNREGPPALWLRLEDNKVITATDEAWESSLAGAAWRNAILASVPRKFGAGSLLSGAEQPLNSLIARWPMLLWFTALAAGILGLGRYLSKMPAVLNFFVARPVVSVITTIAFVWTVLFLNNIPVLPHLTGFDVPHHLEYIQYVRTRWALPFPEDGFEMFQPPFYYVVSALAVSLFAISTDSAFTVLRLMSLGIGIGHLAFIFLSLRLIFPGQIRKQIFGLVLAAFLPMHIYVSHYTTNETLAAALVTAAFYLTLRILRAEKVSPRTCLILGLCLGAALLTKASALLAVPFVLFAVARRLFENAQRHREGLQSLGMIIVGCLVICGWHYGRIWIHCGTPLVFNWDAGTGFAWWQENGYHVRNDFFRMGESLKSPLFSGFQSFPDGVYSTLWGDALAGGHTSMEFRPPWNYDLMAVGYLLALIPMLLIILGAARALWKLIRYPDAAGFLFVGFAATMALALLYLSLRVPSYAQIKAFYGLSALLPLTVFAVEGAEFLARKKICGVVLWLLMTVWAINSYATFWIHHHAVATHIANGLGRGRELRTGEALQHFSRALQLDPTNATLRAFEADSLNLLGEKDLARQKAEQLVKESPASSVALVQLATILAGQDQRKEAARYAKQAVDAAPDNPLAQVALCRCLFESERYEEVVAQAPRALGVAPYNSRLHFYLGMALVRRGEREGLNHVRLASELEPRWPEGHRWLGAVLMEHGELDEAAGHFAEAVRLTPGDPTLQEMAARNQRLIELRKIAAEKNKSADKK